MTDLPTYLDALMQDGRPGDRLPTVRQLMRDFSLSQEKVQQALEALRARGAITAHVGRGTFIRAAAPEGARPAVAPRSEPASAAPLRSMLILSRVIRTARSERVLQQLHDHFHALGVASLQVTYNNEGHAIKMLAGLPNFDGCIVQSQFEPLPVALLSLLAAHSRFILFDGGTTIGIDADYVASNWRGAIDVAANHLWRGGHRSIALLTHDHPARPVDSVQQHFASWAGWTGGPAGDFPIGLLGGGLARASAEDISAALAPILAGSRRPSAVLIWGAAAEPVSAALDRLGLAAPRDLAVILLGHVDIEEEHRRRFTIAGSRADEASEILRDTMVRKFGEAPPSYGGVFLPVHLSDYGSAPGL